MSIYPLSCNYLTLAKGGYNMKRVRKIADEFATDMKLNALPIESKTLEMIASANNWNIVTYSRGFNFIKSHNLEKYYYTSKGFTYASTDATIIFIKDDLEYLDKINVICHEIGHLVLNHIEVGSKQKSIVICDDKIQELEADTFALVLQAPTHLMQSLKITTIHSLVDNGILSKQNAKTRCKSFLQDVYLKGIGFKALLIIAISVVVSLLTLNITKEYYINKYNSLNQQQNTISATMESAADNIAADNINVYITKTGSKYHKQSCHYVKNKNTLAVTLKEARAKGYTPCSICY